MIKKDSVTGNTLFIFCKISTLLCDICEHVSCVPLTALSEQMATESMKVTPLSSRIIQCSGDLPAGFSSILLCTACIYKHQSCIHKLKKCIKKCKLRWRLYLFEWCEGLICISVVKRITAGEHDYSRDLAGLKSNEQRVCALCMVIKDNYQLDWQTILVETGFPNFFCYGTVLISKNPIFGRKAAVIIFFIDTFNFFMAHYTVDYFQPQILGCFNFLLGQIETFSGLI